LAAGAGVATIVCGARLGANADTQVGPEEQFRSPVTGATYVVERDAATQEKRLVAQDGRRFDSVASILETESRALTPIERLLAPDLLAASTDPARADESVDVTFVFRHQPVYEAGVAARGRADPALMEALARGHAILDRIAPLRTMPDGRAPDVATAMREEASLLSDEEKQTLRESRDALHDGLATMRREVMTEATPAVERDQAPLAEYLRGIPGAIDFGGSVTLNSRSARVPVRALAEIVERFPELLRIERVGVAQGQLDTAVQSIGAGSWWNANYIGSSSTVTAVLDTGIDVQHPALSGVVAASSVYLSSGSQQTDWNTNDSTSSSDDFQGHGTRAAGILCSTNSTYTGIAYGGLLLNVKCGYLNNATSGPTSSMVVSDSQQGADWAFNNGATSVSLGFANAGSFSGVRPWPLFFDAASFSLAMPVAVAVRNDGPNASTVGEPADAFNVIACGSFDDNSSVSHGDDSLSSSSGVGPTNDGRQKPDLCGPGVNITTTEYNWEGSNPDFGTSLNGTSNVAPFVAGAYSLLQDAGAAAYPAGLRALLLTTAGNQSPYAGPNNSWGYGALDLAGAYSYRASVYEGQLTSGGSRFALLRGGSMAAGKRATLVWSRHVTSAGASTPTTYYGIQDLDLYVYDESSGTQLASSTSTLNPTEQGAVSLAVSSPIFKVYRASSTFTSSYGIEPFALAAESTTSTALVSAPALACTFTSITGAVAGSSNSTVTVTVANSGDAAAMAPSVTLTLPFGYSVVSGSNPQTIARIAGHSSGSATWTIHSPTGPSGARTISVAATSASYGETFTSATATASQTVDVDPPTASVSIAAGAAATGTANVTVTLIASDTYTGVAQMRVRNAGAAWGAYTSYSNSVAATLPAGDGTKVIEAEFVDGVGNSTATITDSILYDTTSPSGAVTIAGGASYTSSEVVTLTTTASDGLSGVADMRFSNDNVNWGPWGAYAATTSWNLAAGTGLHTVYAQFRDVAGNVSAAASDTIVIETDPPSGTVVVAGGAAWTTSRDVTLTLSASDALSGMHDMRFSNDGLTWGAFVTYGTSAAWTLGAGDGPKTVYAQFRDVAGNLSATATDGISLDGTAPAGSVSIAGGAAYTFTAAVTLDTSATDALNGVTQMRFSNDLSTWSAWQAYATSASWTLSSGDGVKTVYAQFQDGLGNVSAPTPDTILVDTTSPTGTVLVENDAPASAITNVELDLTWADGGSGVTQVHMSNDGANWSAWVPAQPSVPWTTDSGDGMHTVYAQFRDAAGNVSATASDSILIDSTPPTGTFVLNDDAAYVMPWETLTAVTTASDGANGSGVAEFRSSGDGGATWSSWAPIPADKRVTVPRPTSVQDARFTIQGQFRDVAGNVSAATSDASYMVDATARSVRLVSSYTGTVGVNGDIDAVRMELVAGDKLSLKPKNKTLVAKADAHVEIDVYGPDHARVVSGRYPAASKAASVVNFPAPATGEYWIVLRSAGKAADTGVSYALAIANVAAKGTRAKKGAALPDSDFDPPVSTISFPAVDGLKLTGTLTVPLSDATNAPSLLAPDGSTVPITVVLGKKGSMKLTVPSLFGGPGTYVLSIASTGSVKYALTMAPAKPGKLDESAPIGN
jgi:hypothetical protein